MIYKMKHKPLYHYKQEILNTHFNDKEFARLMFSLKNTVDSATVFAIYNDMHSFSTVYDKYFFGNLFPKSIEELGCGNGYFFKPKSISNEISWLFVQISIYREKLQSYTEIRNSVERNILLGYYDEAIELLDKSIELFGYSIWYFESKILIYSLSNKEENIYKLLSEINERKKDAKTGFVTFLLHYLYKRSSQTNSAFNFDVELASKFKMNRNDFQRDRFIYYLFRLNFYKHYSWDDLSSTLVMESTNSLIDRYNLLINLLKASFATQKEQRTLYANWGCKIYRRVKDKQLTPFVAYTQPKLLAKNYYDANFVDILNSYYIGDYNRIVNLIPKYIKKDPSNFDLLKIYARSLLFLGKGYQQISTSENCVLNNITKLIYKIMKEKDSDNYLFQLYGINKNIYGLTLSCGLDYFLKEERNEQYDDDLRLVSIFCFDPYFCRMLEGEKNKLSYLETPIEWINCSEVVTYQKKKISKEIPYDSPIVKYIKEIDRAKIKYENGDYLDSLNLWQNILAEYKESLPIAQSAVEFIFKCYLALNENQNAIIFYVNHFLDSHAYLSRVQTSQFSKDLYKNKYKNGVKNTIDLLLFVFLNATEEEHKSFVLERYCAYQEVSKASELIDLLKNSSNIEKVELLFYLLATEDILRHMRYVKSTKQMLEEQQLISQFLTGLNSKKHDLYESINQELRDTMIVYQNIKKIDESKIYANTASISRYELKDYIGLYNQFKHLYDMSTHTDMLCLVNASNIQGETSQDTTVINAPVIYTNRAFIDVACQIFDVVLDKFLLSKFGLKTYLSTRIRHGVLEGEIRSGFDRLNLVLATENNRYMPIDFWRHEYGLNNVDQQDLMKILENFSRGINKQIALFKDSVLQIKLKPEDKGFFNYILDDNTKCFAVVNADANATNYDDFCNMIMEYLCILTSKNLTEIRQEIESNWTNSFTILIDKLEQDIQRFEKKHFYCGLKAAVNNARAEINAKLQKVESWFYLQDAKFEDFLLSQQIETVWNIMLKTYPNIDSELNVEITDANVLIKAKYFVHISDILTIFFNNMFSYCRPKRQRQFSISAKLEGDLMHLHFENEIKEDEEMLNKKFEEMLSSYNRLQTEGRSGLVKVRKIIKYDLGCEDNELQIVAENGFCKTDVFINIKDLKV